MANDQQGTKRPVELAEPTAPEGKRCKTFEDGTSSKDKQSVPSTLPESVSEALAVLAEIVEMLRQKPFGMRETGRHWHLKRSVRKLLPVMVDRGLAEPELRDPVFAVVDQLVCSGYAESAMARKELVELGAWKPALAILADKASTASRKVAAVLLYLHLSDHVNFYEDFAGKHPDFWDPAVFGAVLKHMPLAVVDLPEDIDADQWELSCPDLEMSMKCLGSFILFWTSSGKLVFDLAEAMPLLDGIVSAVATFDAKFGSAISAKCRGDPLEELVRLGGILAQFVLTNTEESLSARGSRRRHEDSKRQSMLLLNFLVRILTLRIPTCVWKPEAGALDERQLDSEWFEGLWEHCDGFAEGALRPSTLCALFKIMVGMPLEEQRYRLECVSGLVPAFVALYAEELKDKVVPPDLVDLKTVLNTVLQDDASVAQELLEEVSFYPCLLDFATKRATIHAVCERVKLQSSSGDPIRLVVPRDNVLDGVCDSLNLREQSARIDVPVEIEFRAGYADDAGNELADEGEDQGGLRRQWLDRASRHFVTSDLFTSPSEDSRIFVPSSEAVCRCVQDDWEEQFELFGCILGFAILHKETIPVHFGHNFLRSIFGLKIAVQDLLPLLEGIDKTLYTKLKYILDGTYTSLGDSLEDALELSRLPRVFAIRESHCPELVRETLLKANGAQIPVTEENKEEFIMLFLDQILINGVARQVECFRHGLLRVIPEDVVQRVGELMTPKEIELMVCGADDIDVDDWEKHTQYENGYSVESQPVRWFWDEVRSMCQQARASLLSFATGSSQVPSGGFRFLQPEMFTIQRVATVDRYPEAHTCANMIDLPEYTSRDELAKRLGFAVNETGDAFGRR